MRTLDLAAQNRAATWIRHHGRPLERARYAARFAGAPARNVLEALSAYRNDGGGFARALEPDVWTPEASVLATTTALEILHEVGANAREPLVAGALRWIEGAFDPASEAWPMLPAGALDHPHAPHWELDEVWHAQRHVNPGARVLAAQLRWGDARCAERARADAAKLPARVREVGSSLGADGVRCLLDLLSAAGLDAPLAEELSTLTRELATGCVERDPAAWARYGNFPAKLAPTPGSPTAGVLADEVAAHLDWLIEHQRPDGSWPVTWSWSERDPEVWDVAERQWRGVVTLETLATLEAWGRLESAA